MSKLSQEIKDYVSCPQINGKPFGRWGSLNSKQRIKIWNLAHQCEVFESVADDCVKELDKYKRAFEILKDVVIVSNLDGTYLLSVWGNKLMPEPVCYLEKEQGELLEELMKGEEDKKII